MSKVNARSKNASLSCPCGLLRNYVDCCGHYHAGENAPTAEALMRSRYSAFVMQNEGYLLASWHARTRPASVSFESDTKWLGLKIVAARELDAQQGEVEFIARFRVGGASAQRIHERSRFVRDAGCWLYVDGFNPGSA